MYADFEGKTSEDFVAFSSDQVTTLLVSEGAVTAT